MCIRDRVYTLAVLGNVHECEAPSMMKALLTRLTASVRMSAGRVNRYIAILYPCKSVVRKQYVVYVVRLYYSFRFISQQQ